MIHKLAGIYHRLPVKPFHNILVRLYRRYSAIHRNKVVIAVRDGVKWELDLNEYIDSTIYHQECFKPRTVKMINNIVKEGMTVLDIGANIGCHTLRFAKLVGTKGRVIAIEPMPWAIKKLQRNISLNSFTNITLEKIALSDKSIGKQIVQFQSSWPLHGKLFDGSVHSVHPEENKVEIITLEDYVQQKQITKIEFIKLAVGGYEHKIIKGGLNIIKTYHPIMIIEFTKYAPKWYGDTFEGLIDLLYSIEYSFYSDIDFRQYIDKESVINAIPPRETRNLLVKPNIN